MPDSHLLAAAPPPVCGAEVRLPDFAGRRRAAVDLVRRVLGRADVLLVADRHDIRYLTGVAEGISWLAVSGGVPFAVSRHMLADEVRERAPDCEVLLPCDHSTDRPELERFMVSELARRGLRHAVLDPVRTSAQAYLRLTDWAAPAGVAVALLADPVARLRAVKDAWEVRLMRRCVEIAEQAFIGLLGDGAGGLVGRTERELANELDARMRALGADRQGFADSDIIVASGPNSAKPHHTSGERRLVAGEPLLIDWGAEVSAYRSDSTRTVFLERVPEFARRAYPVVERALERAARRLCPAALMGEIDQAARETVTATGYCEFHYGVGHGVGLQIHEAPWIRAHSTERLEAGMLTTLEPGVYLPGTGGIRIENVYQIHAGGAERLGTLPTSLESMVVC